jgi:hypothetical protein
LLVLCCYSEFQDTDRAIWDNVRIIYGAYASQPDRLREFCERTVGALVRQDADEDDRPSFLTSMWISSPGRERS